MTTPQSTLQSLEYSIRSVCEMLEGDEEKESLIDRLHQIEAQQCDLMTSMQRLENLMNVIIQLLSKNNEKANRKS